MRILTVGNMYPPHHLGGYELTWLSAVHHLRGSGHTVRVLTTDYRDPSRASGPEEDADVHRELRWYWHDHDFPRLSLRARLRIERHNATVLARHLAELRPDVVTWWAMGGMSLGLIEQVRRRRLPAVGVVGDAWMSYGPKVDAWTRLFARRRRAPARVAERLTGLPAEVDLSTVLWLFNSEATRATAEAGQRLPFAEIAHPGVDTTLFRRAAGHEWRWRLLCVGRIDPRKGLDTAIETLPQLPAEATLRIVGAGDERHRAELQALARRLTVADRVTFTTRERGELPAEYAAADALLFPVRWDEPWGLVPLEAMAVGTAVVATGTGGSAEYLRPEGNALVLGRAATGSDFAAAARRLAEDVALRARLREEGFATASRYTERSYNLAIERALEQAARRLPGSLPAERPLLA